MPTFKEKMEVSFMDSGSPFSIVALLVGLGDIASKEALDWAIGCTDAVKACGELTRYMNDISALKVKANFEIICNCSSFLKNGIT